MVSLPGNGKKWFIQPLFKMQLLKPSALLKPWPRQSVQLFTPIPTRSEIPGQTTTATPQIVCGCLMWHPCFAYQKIQMKHHLHLHIRNLIISHESTGLPLVYHWFTPTIFGGFNMFQPVSVDAPSRNRSHQGWDSLRTCAGHNVSELVTIPAMVRKLGGGYHIIMVSPWFYPGFTMVSAWFYPWYHVISFLALFFVGLWLIYVLMNPATLPGLWPRQGSCPPQIEQCVATAPAITPVHPMRNARHVSSRPAVLVFCPNYYINQLNTLPVEATVNTNLCEHPDFKHSHTVIRV